MRATIVLILAATTAAWLAGGCQQTHFDLDAATIQAYRTRAAAQQPTGASRRGDSPGRPMPRGGRPDAHQPAPTTQPGLGDSASLGLRRAARTVALSLQDTLARGLANSLDIRVESYATGISAADVVAAQAAFDAVVYLDFTYSKLDEATNSTFFTGGKIDNRHMEVGIRKRLATGAEISASHTLDRVANNQPFQAFNPHTELDNTLTLTQPLLRNFGLDVNRSDIYVARNNRDISAHAFRRQVIATLADIEQAYWNLYFARQSLAVQRDLLAQTEETRKFIRARLEFDALQVQLSQANSAVARRRADVIRLAADVKDAEDALKNLLNDPGLPLEEDVAIVPIDQPLTGRLDINDSEEFWAALENRSELKEARLTIANANITRGVAKNQLLPRLDLFLQWNMNALAGNYSNTTEQLYSGRFQDYVVGLSFEFPLGNRAAEAAVRKSQLQLEQAVAAYHNLAADVMTETQIALRDVRTSYDEILANSEAAQAAQENLTSLIERRERLSPEYLDVQLQAQETLANARRSLQQAVTNYNNAIVRLEQAKGTLLRYDKVELLPEGR